MQKFSQMLLPSPRSSVLVFPLARMCLVGQVAKGQCITFHTRKLSIGTSNEMNKEL